MGRPFASFLPGLVLACSTGAISPAQSWVLDRVSPVVVMDSGAVLDLDHAGDLIALGIARADGGSVHVLHKDQGGADQWGTLSTLISSEPWFGHAVAMHGSFLAIGSPGAQENGAYSGQVLVAAIDPFDQLQPMTILDTLHPPGSVTGDRAGYDLVWNGDTLLVGVPGRPGTWNTGSVWAWSVHSGSAILLGALPSDPFGSALPFDRWFGARMALDTGRGLIVAAPYSGFNGSQPSELVGSLLTYAPVSVGPIGWALDTAFAFVDYGANCQPVRQQWGVHGLAMDDGVLVAGSFSSSTWGAPSGLVPWPRPAEETCASCALYILERSSSGWELDSSLFITPGPTERHVPGAWSLDQRELAITTLDALNTTWSTVFRRRDPGQMGSWAQTEDLPATGPCALPIGPLLLRDDVLLRTILARGTGCSMPIGQMRVDIEVWRR
ncbi:MAG: hypothetical protein KDB88_03695 [Flavobacteriales bacterium]|nr:hypothetical protein [Flavobacteriales bacterium]